MVFTIILLRFFLFFFSSRIPPLFLIIVLNVKNLFSWLKIKYEIKNGLTFDCYEYNEHDNT